MKHTPGPWKVNETMKIQMLETRIVLPHYEKFTKGRTYSAMFATNQPNWENLGLVFAIKKSNGNEILLDKSEYKIVERS